jgi:hypothetical protein
MGLIKDPKAHPLTMHDGKGSFKEEEEWKEVHVLQ